MPEKKDIFDRIMSLPGLNYFEQFYRKNKEVLLYLFFGGLAFFISVGSYAVFNVRMAMNELLANLFSWILAVLFAFFTNRTWVFEGQTESTKEFIKQMISFFQGRIFTLAIEELILLIFITWLSFNSMVIKVIAQVVVIVLNYIISKLWVFRK